MNYRILMFDFVCKTFLALGFRVCVVCICVAFVQNVSGQACFNANVTRGCAPLSVIVTDCSNTPNPALTAYKYSEAEGFVSRNTNTYMLPGMYAITQIVQKADGTGDSLRRQNYVEVLPSPLPLFSVRSCANRKVSLDISDTQYEQYIINWGDGSALQMVNKGALAVEHTYTGTGSFVLKVKGNYSPGNCGAEKALLISPLSLLPTPAIQSISTTVKNAVTGSVVVRLLAKIDFDYEIYANATPLPVASFEGVNGVITKNLDNLNTLDALLCFQVKILDKCGANTSSLSYYCHLALDVVAEDSQNVLQWTPYTGSVPANSFLQYVIYRNSQALKVVIDITQNKYIDEEVLCKENYCYNIVAEFASANFNFISTSNSECINAFSNIIPPQVAKLNATVETARSIRLFWDVENEPKIVNYEIKRNNVVINSNTNQLGIVDADLRIEQPFCYEVRYKNVCGNVSEWAVKVCPVFLVVVKGQSTQPQIAWTAYQNPLNMIEQYVVQKLDERLQVYEEVTLSTASLQFTDNVARTDRQVMRYRIKTVVQASESVVSYSNVVEINQKFKLFFPNAFTPDGNGKNEVFKPAYLFVKHFKMSIFNRNGELLFETKDIEKGWDGKHKGKVVPNDSYVYLAEAEDNLGEKFTVKSTFILIK